MKPQSKLPISVIVPLSPQRKDFFQRFVLPMLEVNNPAEIIVMDEDGSAARKRNEGFKKSAQEYVAFWDDDCVAPAGYFLALYELLRKQPQNIGYAYTGFKGIRLYEPDKKEKSSSMVFTSPTKDFNENDLKGARCGISTMSLMRGNIFCGFDESLTKLEDLDLYIALLLRHQIKGIMLHGWQFHAFYVDRGLTFSGGNAQALEAVRQKWGLPGPSIVAPK